jgi:hypothetical protein
MPQNPQPFGQRAKTALVRLVVVLLVLALAGAVVVLLSRLNARTYSIEQRGQELVVLKGRNLPFGAAPYLPSDPRLVDAYAPIPFEGVAPESLVGVTFEDREALDRALFEVLIDRAELRITSEDTREQEEALLAMRRAEKLNGITEEQQLSLRRVQAEAAFYQARYRLDEARRLTAEAMVQLRLAAESSTQNARAANQMLAEVSPAARALEEALRRAVHVLSGPARAAEKDADEAPPKSAPTESNGEGAQTPEAAPAPTGGQGTNGAAAPATDGDETQPPPPDAANEVREGDVGTLDEGR